MTSADIHVNSNHSHPGGGGNPTAAWLLAHLQAMVHGGNPDARDALLTPFGVESDRTF